MRRSRSVADPQALGLLLELRAGNRQPLQHGGGAGLGVAHLRQPMRPDRLVLRGVHLILGALGDKHRGGAERGLRLAFLLLRERPPQMQKRGLGIANVGGQALEPRCLPGLALQVLDLVAEFAHDIVEALQILLGRAQSQLGLVATRMEPGDAGRLLKQRAARLRLRLYQLADTALPHHGGRARAGRLIREEELNVLCARLLAVDAVDRTGLALDATRDLEFVGIVEGGGRAAVAIVEEERDLGGIARGARRGAGEDDVVHAGRAHVLVGTLAHHPAKGLDEVRLAAAIRPDDAGQARLDDEFGRFDEGLETEEPEAGEAHQRSPGSGGRTSMNAPRDRRAEARGLSDHAVDDRRHFVNRHGSRVFPAVYEEGRSGIHLEFIRPALPDFPDVGQKLLIGQAGLEALL
jgi:hypothetical protein